MMVECHIVLLLIIFLATIILTIVGTIVWDTCKEIKEISFGRKVTKICDVTIKKDIDWISDKYLEHEDRIQELESTITKKKKDK